MQNADQLELFKTFCSTDDLRPVMLLPFESNGKVYATDAHKLIRCDSQLIHFTLQNPHKSLNPSSAFPEINCNRTVVTKIEDFDILKTEDELSKIGDNITCEECKGEGYVEWEYKHHTAEHECPECKCSGYSHEARFVPNGKKCFPKYAYATIDGLFFNINILISIFEAHEIIGGEIISLNKLEKARAAMFKIGDYEFLIMPIYNDGSNVSLLDIKFNS
jgi:hypothetical protein